MLEVGEYKNYKAICEAMGWEPVGGDAKKKQLKELNNLCNYHKEGHKFIIDEVFENPILVFDNKRSQIMNELQTMIFYLALKEGSNELIISKNRLLIALGLLNANFMNIMCYKEKYAEYRNIPTYQVHEVISVAYTRICNHLNNTLKKLDDISLFRTTKDVISVSLQTGENRLATADEIAHILKCETTVLKEYGVENRSNIPYFELSNFKSKVTYLLKDKGIRNYYYSYRIIKNEDLSKYVKIPTEEEVEIAFAKVNNHIQNSTFKSLEKKFFSYKDMYTSVEELEEILGIKFNDTNNPNIDYQELEELEFELSNILKERIFDLILDNKINLPNLGDVKYNIYMSKGFLDNSKVIIDDSINKDRDKIDL